MKLEPFIFAGIFILYTEIYMYIIGAEYFESIKRDYERLWDNHCYAETIEFVQQARIQLIIFLNVMYFLNVGKIRSKLNKLLRDAVDRKTVADSLRIVGND